MTITAAHSSLAAPLTSQHVQDEVHVRGEDLDALHAGYGPDGDELVAVHLGHQVQILGEVFSAAQKQQIRDETAPSKLYSQHAVRTVFLPPGEVELQLFLQGLSEVLGGDRLFFGFRIDCGAENKTSAGAQTFSSRFVCSVMDSFQGNIWCLSRHLSADVSSNPNTHTNTFPGASGKSNATQMLYQRLFMVPVMLSLCRHPQLHQTHSCG